MAQPATTSPPSLGAEDHSPPPLSASSIQEEPRELDTITTVDQTTQKDQQNTQLTQSIEQPPLPKEAPSPTPSIPIDELRNLSTVLSAFQSCFNDLQHHLNTVKSAVDSLIIAIPPQEKPNIATSPLKSSLPQSSSIIFATNATPTEENDKKSKKCEENLTNHSSLELQNLCQTMCGRGLKRYLVSNLNEINRLREEVPKALKRAPNPAKLVLECTGRFFLQGSKAYVHKDSPMVTGREASVLVLECFLLMRGEENETVEIEREVKDEADRAAVLWKKRILTEGGLARACEIDARGLLLLVACFGLPERFKNDDLRDLLQASKARDLKGTLRKSSVLMEKVPDIIEGMLKNKMEVDAVDIAYTFGLEDRFNTQMILTSFLKRTKESSKKAKRAAQASPSALNLANKKKLAVLKSVLQCLEGHKIDLSKLLPGWKLGEKISALEKVVTEFDKDHGEEMMQKRKANEAEPAKNLKPQEVKRPRFNGQGPQRQKAVGLVDSQRHLRESGIPGHITSYSASPSILYATAAGTGQYAAGIYGGMIVDPAARMATHNVQPYAWRGDPTLSERVTAHSYAVQPSSASVSSLYGPSPSLDGYAMVPTASSLAASSRNASDLYQFADNVVKNEYQPPAMPPHHTSYL